MKEKKAKALENKIKEDDEERKMLLMFGQVKNTS